jgi:hypothetical protein
VPCAAIPVVLPCDVSSLDHFFHAPFLCLQCYLPDLLLINMPSFTKIPCAKMVCSAPLWHALIVTPRARMPVPALAYGRGVQPMCLTGMPEMIRIYFSRSQGMFELGL